MQFIICATPAGGNKENSRYFLVESFDHEIARALFIANHGGWDIALSGVARCLAGGDQHRGELSVWQGREGKTVVLCQYHGEKIPNKK